MHPEAPRCLQKQQGLRCSVLASVLVSASGSLRVRVRVCVRVCVSLRDVCMCMCMCVSGMCMYVDIHTYNLAT